MPDAHPRRPGPLSGRGHDRRCRHSRTLCGRDRVLRHARTACAAPDRTRLRRARPRRRHGRRDAGADPGWRHSTDLPLPGGYRRQGGGGGPAHARRRHPRAHRTVLRRAGTAHRARGTTALVAPVVDVDRATGDAMKPVRFDYYRAETVADATGVLAELREDVAVLAGGMSLGPMLNLRLVRPRAVIDITRIAELDKIEPRDGMVATGAAVTQADAYASDIVRRDIPLLARALPWVGHFQTRNRGTLGGSVAHADPSAEIPLCLVVSDGTVVLRTRRRERRVRARDFFLGMLTTARQADELLVALEWPRAPADAGHAFEEIAQRHGDFAICAAACRIRLDGRGRIASLDLGLGGVESRPAVVDTAASLGRPVDDGTAQELGDHAVRSLVPLEDHVATADYRLALARVLLARVVHNAAADAQQRRAA